jgi:colanic acid biosynthesis protein WcaH
MLRQVPRFMHLDEQTFLRIVDATPLVSVDLVVRDSEGRVLLGQRTNRPAQGFWFVPGGRIRKNERIDNALTRIAQAELGANADEAEFMGVYEHLYPDNFSGQAGISTHYIVLAYTCEFPPQTQPQPDAQHSQFKWWKVEDLLRSAEVHENTKRYFLS